MGIRKEIEPIWKVKPKKYEGRKDAYGVCKDNHLWLSGKLKAKDIKFEEEVNGNRHNYKIGDWTGACVGALMNEATRDNIIYCIGEAEEEMRYLIAEAREEFC